MRDAMTQPATAEQIANYATAKGIDIAAAEQELSRMREKQIAARTNYPFNCGYEPPIWYVVKALLRNPMWSNQERAYIRRRLGDDWTAETFASAMQRRLGFSHPVTKVLIMGANRSGKTDFIGKLIMQTLLAGNKKVCWGAQTHQTQKKNQMRRIWKYMPDDLKAKNIATKKANDVTENISFTEKNGFAGSRLTLKNGSELDFITYEQTTNSLEGVEYDLATLDEEYPIAHYNLMTTRITSRLGQFIGTFTPLNGYTPSIAAFLNGSETVRWHTAYLRPKDGMKKLPWKELNLTEEEYEKLNAWRRQGMQGDCGIPESRPEDCFEWLFDEGDGRDTAEDLDGRQFDCTPRVCRCQGGEAAAIWFYGSDNPYGMPSELIRVKMADENAEQKIYEAVYGMARDMKGKLFRTFDKSCIIPMSELPKKLVRFQVIDPAPERNWCMGWFGYHPPTETLYLYRGWPDHYEIPGQGVPGPWVIPSDKNRGLNDGARGEAQNSFGFGYNQIKFEIARLEGWKDYIDWVDSGNDPMVMPPDDEIESWSEENGARERMAFRLLDSRAASQSKISKGTNQTLLEDLDEQLVGLQVADGQRIEIGYNRLNDKLAKGKFKVVATCLNAIDCFNLLTGKDGLKGAAKDFIDLCRYAVMSDIWNYTSAQAVEIGLEIAAPKAPRSGLPHAFAAKKRRVWWGNG